jgi:hypothetical protein
VHVNTNYGLLNLVLRLKEKRDRLTNSEIIISVNIWAETENSIVWEEDISSSSNRFNDVEGEFLVNHIDAILKVEGISCIEAA